jgi:hypothetical protein
MILPHLRSHVMFLLIFIHFICVYVFVSSCYWSLLIPNRRSSLSTYYSSFHLSATISFYLISVLLSPMLSPFSSTSWALSSSFYFHVLIILFLLTLLLNFSLYFLPRCSSPSFIFLVCSLESSGMYCHVVKLMLTNVSEVHTAFIIRVVFLRLVLRNHWPFLHFPCL